MFRTCRQYRVRQIMARNRRFFTGFGPEYILRDWHERIIGYSISGAAETKRDSVHEGGSFEQVCRGRTVEMGEAI